MPRQTEDEIRRQRQKELDMINPPARVQPRAGADPKAGGYTLSAPDALQVWHLNGLSTEQLDLASRMIEQFHQRLPDTFDQTTRSALILKVADLLFGRIAKL